ncbi:unnamed protein product [Gordionus sp. m RMFG-2023]
MCVKMGMTAKKCEDMSRAFNSQGWPEQLECVITKNDYECMRKIENSGADIVNLDSGLVYIAGVHYSMVPLLAESYGPESNSQPSYKTIALVKTNSHINSLADLKGTKSCHTAVGMSAGWIIPIGVLYEKNLLPSFDCDNPVIAISKFFNGSCAPNALIKDNNLGFNPSSVCSACSNIHMQCMGYDRFAGEQGAFECLKANKGDVAFLRESTPIILLKEYENIEIGFQPQDYSLLCLNGEKRPVNDFENCHWGFVPGNAIMTLSSQSEENKTIFKNYFLRAQEVFGINLHVNASFTESSFKMFNSVPYRNVDILFSDTTLKLVDVKERNTFRSYLGSDYLKVIENMRRCDVKPIIWCVISRNELNKCERMRLSFKAKDFIPAIKCTQGKSKNHCMDMIANGDATMSLFEAAEIYEAGKHYNLIPIIAENYGLIKPEYHAVVLAKRSDLETNFLSLKGKRTCHGAFESGAGWYIPIFQLETSGQMRVLPSDKCRLGKSASEFFQQSCVPGALSPIYGGKHKRANINGRNLCDLCIGTGDDFCRRNDAEPFYGDSGSLRCLVEGGGQVAFVRHTTLADNADGRNGQNWARFLISGDFELLCKDGSRASVKEWERCYLEKVPSDAIMVSRERSAKEIRAYEDLFMTAQEFFSGRGESNFYNNEQANYGSMDFKLFVSQSKAKNIIFNDAAIKLTRLPEENQNYENYLGDEFIQIMESVKCGSIISLPNFLLISISINIIIFVTP